MKLKSRDCQGLHYKISNYPISNYMEDGSTVWTLRVITNAIITNFVMVSCEL